MPLQSLHPTKNDCTSHAPRLAAFSGRDYGGIDGRFHSHITVLVGADPERLEVLQGLCRTWRAKLTLIDLSDFAGRSQRDVMITRHHRKRGADAVSRLIDVLIATTGAVEEAGYQVIRVKLEHESLPTLPYLNGMQYREAHIKLAIPVARFEAAMSWLRDQGPVLGFVPSRNPRESKAEHIVQFVNVRVYDGSVLEADQRIERVVAHLRAHGFQLTEAKYETSVLDTHLPHDRWWTPEVR